MHRTWRGDVRMASRLAILRPHRRNRIALAPTTRNTPNAMLTPEMLPDVQRALADAGVDGWLLYDFRGLNPISADLMGLEGMTSRRVFAFVPTLGVPVAISHAIEQSQWKHWPKDWRREVYSSWRSLESYVSKHVAGKRVAMEYSAGDAVPYLDRVP